MEQRTPALDDVRRGLDAVRAANPLVHNITNFVVMEVTANALLAIGASPVMAHAPEEMAEITGMASALVLNIGTLSLGWTRAMETALATATARGIPVVIDPVGAGASRLRTDTALNLLARSDRPLLRGNASEIIALAGGGGNTKGVDSTASSGEAGMAARELALRYGCVVSVSGGTDMVTDGRATRLIQGGSALMPRVTGMGCAASALAGAFAGVCGRDNGMLALVAAMSVMAAAGSAAAAKAHGPGSFLPRFLDSLWRMDEAMLRRGARISSPEACFLWKD